jgi:hypothetical protein
VPDVMVTFLLGHRTWCLVVGIPRRVLINRTPADREAGLSDMTGPGPCMRGSSPVRSSRAWTGLGFSPVGRYVDYALDTS